jgi:hypothetical protein
MAHACCYCKHKARHNKLVASPTHSHRNEKGKSSSYMWNTLDIWICMHNCTWICLSINGAKFSHFTCTVCILAILHIYSNAGSTLWFQFLNPRISHLWHLGNMTSIYQQVKSQIIRWGEYFLGCNAIQFWQRPTFLQSVRLSPHCKALLYSS